MTNNTFRNPKELLAILGEMKPKDEIFLLCTVGRQSRCHLKLDRDQLRKTVENLDEENRGDESIEGEFTPIMSHVWHLVIGDEFYRGRR